MIAPMHDDATRVPGGPAEFPQGNTLAATYYDGESSQGHPVELRIVGETLMIYRGTNLLRTAPFAEVKVSEPMGRAPRTLRLREGGHCEVADLAGLAAWLAGQGRRESWVVRFQARWHLALGSLVAVILAVAAAYYWGLPVAADWIAARLPDRAVAEISRSTLETVDTFLKPTQLPEARQQALRARLAELGERVPLPPYHLHFRRGGSPNAFALPSGDIVVLDSLVKLAANDEEVIAVLTHELGHVHYRHGLRQVLQSSAVSVALAAWLGDVSSLGAALGGVVLTSRYSREFESEADAYGARMLLAAGSSPAYLADILERLDAAYGSRSEEEEAGGKAGKHSGGVENPEGEGPVARAPTCPPADPETEDEHGGDDEDRSDAPASPRPQGEGKTAPGRDHEHRRPIPYFPGFAWVSSHPETAARVAALRAMVPTPPAHEGDGAAAR